MNRQKLKIIAALGLLAIVIGLFINYVHGHPAMIQELRHLNPWLIVVLLLAYGILSLWLLGIYNATLRLCGEPLPANENLLLGIYSMLANFFLPLQSGPGVRAAYLKRRHKVSVSAYLLANMVYYGIYAIISAAFIFSASRYWWLGIPAALGAGLFSILVIMFATKKILKNTSINNLDLSRANLTRLTFMTLGQVATIALIFGIELHSLHLAHDSIRQVLSYTGTANFALFVALTPGAIGFREAFLEFGRSLNHFTTANILAASLIDRSVYLVFLGILFVIMLATHARNRLKI